MTTLKTGTLTSDPYVVILPLMNSLGWHRHSLHRQEAAGSLINPLIVLFYPIATLVLSLPSEYRDITWSEDTLGTVGKSTSTLQYLVNTKDGMRWVEKHCLTHPPGTCDSLGWCLKVGHWAWGACTVWENKAKLSSGSQGRKIKGELGCFSSECSKIAKKRADEVRGQWMPV